jgi:predicted ATPase
LRRPVLFALDDLHWADAATAELVSYLLRRPPRRRVLFLLAFRRANLPSVLRSALDASVRDRHVARVELEPLSRDEARVLLGSRVDPKNGDELFRLSGGNPFYLDELARAGAIDGSVDEAVEPPEVVGQIPAPVDGVIAAELSSLTDQARALLRGAAVMGDPFEAGLAATVAEIRDADLALLDELIEADLIRPTEVPRRFAFRHPLLRHAVYLSSGAGWVIGAHSRAAAALEAQGAPVSARAHHVDQAGTVGDEEAISVLIQAGDATARRSPGAAARWYAAALRLMPLDASNPLRRIAVLESFASALEAKGRLDEARDALLTALDLCTPAETTRRVSLSIRCAGMELLLGRHAAARDRLQRAFANLPDGESEDAAALEMESSFAALYSFDIPAMRQHAARALDIATFLGSTSLQASAAALVALAESEDPQEDVLTDALAHAEGLIDGLSDEDLGRRIEAAHALGWAELHTGHLPKRTDTSGVGSTWRASRGSVDSRCR